MAKFWLLEFMNPPPGIADRKVKLEGEAVTVGRIEGNSVVIGWDPKISRMHARLELTETGVRLTDLNSTNGTHILENFKWRQLSAPEVLQGPVTVKFGDTVVTASHGEFVDTHDPSLFQSMVLSLPEVLDGVKLRESILVLDQHGSTPMAGRAGDEVAFHLKKRMFQLCDAAFKRHPPEYVKNTGDGLFATFKEAGACLKAALMIGSHIGQRNRNTQNPPIHVRIGLHCGETFLMDKITRDRHGVSVNTAFRIEGVTQESFTPGVPLPDKDRILASGEFVQASGAETGAFTLLGPANLKGIDSPIELFIFAKPF